MNSVHFLDGKLVSEDELRVSPRDLGYSRGYGVFEFLTTYKHRPFMLEKHVDRLFQSAKIINLAIPWPKEEISEWILKTVDSNKVVPGEKAIRITISGGPSLTLMPPPNTHCRNHRGSQHFASERTI